MNIELLQRKKIGINEKGIFSYRSYRLPDMSYGSFLIYKALTPKYYINIFDEKYIEIRKCQEKLKITLEELLKMTLNASSGRGLKMKESTWINFGRHQEEFVNYEIEEFPVSIWDEAKDKI